MVRSSVNIYISKENLNEGNNSPVKNTIPFVLYLRTFCTIFFRSFVRLFIQIFILYLKLFCRLTVRSLLLMELPLFATNTINSVYFCVQNLNSFLFCFLYNLYCCVVYLMHQMHAAGRQICIFQRFYYFCIF